jgi:hypothetical protein
MLVVTLKMAAGQRPVVVEQVASEARVALQVLELVVPAKPQT